MAIHLPERLTTEDAEFEEKIETDDDDSQDETEGD
jgi:hypothetical protein